MVTFSITYVQVYTDHSAVKTVLLNPNNSGKHARWWTKAFGSGLREVEIVHKTGKLSSNVDALSCKPCWPASQVEIGESEVQVANITESESDQIEEFYQQMINMHAKRFSIWGVLYYIDPKRQLKKRAVVPERKDYWKCAWWTLGRSFL